MDSLIGTERDQVLFGARTCIAAPKEATHYQTRQELSGYIG